MRPAAFFDVDGTLLRSNPSTVLRYCLTARTPRLRVAWHTVREVCRVPALIAAELWDRGLSNRLLYAAYGGLEEQHLLRLADELVETVLVPRLFQGAADLIKRCQDDGMTGVLVSGAPHFVIRRLGVRLGLEEELCFGNRLEFMDGRCTGRLLPPILAGHGKVQLVRELAQRHGFDLAVSSAWSDDTADLPLLSAVGHPTAVNPTPNLRKVAQQRGWPTLEL